MGEPLDGYEDIEVTVKRLQCSEEQIEAIKEWLKQHLRESLINFNYNKSSRQGRTFYEITFLCDEPNRFDGDLLGDKLEDMMLVKWEIDGRLIKGTRKNA